MTTPAPTSNGRNGSSLVRNPMMPLASRTIPNAHVAVAKIARRSPRAETGRSRQPDRAAMRANPLANAAAMNAGQVGPSGPNSVSRIGPSAVDAPYAAYAIPIAVARVIPSYVSATPASA